MSNNVLKAVGAMALTGLVVGTAAYWKGYSVGVATENSTVRLENKLQNLQVCDSVYSALAENSVESVNKEFADDRVFVIKMAAELSEDNPMRDVYLVRSEQIRQDAEAALYLQRMAATLAYDTCVRSLANPENR